MNDFTKKEIQDIYWCCAKKGLEGWANIEVTLLQKIQSMIDNYPECDHQFQLCRCFYGVDENQYRCKKCLKTYEEVTNDN